MKKSTYKAFMIVLSVLLVIGLTGTVWSLIGYRSGAGDYEEAEELAGISSTVQQEMSQEETPQEVEDPYVTALLETDLLALREVNSDVLGWIQIPDTKLSYPLVQGTDNDHYLHYTWQNQKNSVGAVFMDYRNSKDLSDFNTVIYGHNMKDDSMFGQLNLFRNEDYLKEHPHLYIVDDQGCKKYSIFAAYEVSVATAESYQLSFSGDEERQTFIDDCLQLSRIDSGIVPTVNDQIVTLSTCTGWGYETRWVVQAVLSADESA